MDTVLQELATIAHEVRKIIRSPYAPSLRPLYDILDRSSRHAIEIFLDSNECCIDAFTAVVLQSLEFYPGSIRVLSVLLPLHGQFLAASVSRAPSLLAICLEKANLPGDFQQHYREISTCLLAKVEHETLPVQAPDFLNRFVKDFTRNPSNESLGDALTLLRSSTIIWPAECLEGIQAATIRVLREGHDDEGISLLCLAVLAELSNSSQLNDDCRSQCSDFFSGKKSSKSLMLGITSCIKSLSAHLDGTREASATAEHLRLARSIFEALDGKPMLVLDRTVCLFTRKMCEKLDKPGLNSEIQLEGSIALAVLLEDKLQQAIIDLVERLALNRIRMPRNPTAAFERFVTKFSDVFASSALRQALEVCIDTDMDDAKALKAFKVDLLTGQLLNLLPKHPRVRDSVRKAFAQPAMQQRLLDLVSETENRASQASEHQRHGCCSRCMADSQSRISITVCQLFLLGFPDTDMHLSSLAAHYLARNKTPDTHTILRASQDPRMDGNLPLKEISARSVDSTRWGDNLRDILQNNATVQAGELDEYFQAICLDLERRCHDVEQPLRERERTIAQLNTTIDGLKITVHDQQQALNATAQQKEKLSQEVSMFGQQLHDVQTRSAQALSECLAERDSAVCELGQTRAVHTEREQELHLKQAEVDRYSTRCHDLEREKDDIATRLSTSEAEIGAQDEEHAAAKRELAAEKQARTVLEEELTEVQQALADISMTNQKTNTLLQEKNTRLEELDTLVASLQATLDTLKNDKVTLEEHLSSAQQRTAELEEDMVSQNERLVITKEQELSDQSIFYDQALDQLRLEVQHANETISVTSRRHQDEVHALKQELRSLRQEKEKRAKELMQAQQLGRQLMGLMQQPTDGGRPMVTPQKKCNTGEMSTDTLSSAFDETQVSESRYSQDEDQLLSQIPDRFASMKPSPRKRRALGRRALSELPPQSPRKLDDVRSGGDRRTSWAPQHKKRASAFPLTATRDENFHENKSR